MKTKIIPADQDERDFFAHVHSMAYREVIEQMFGWEAKKLYERHGFEVNEANDIQWNMVYKVA